MTRRTIAAIVGRMQPRVTAIVLNTWAGRQTVACVKNLLNQTVADAMEVIVVDNHSQDDSIGYIRNNLKDPRVRIAETRRNLGFGGGYGTGLTLARGEYVLINNPDKMLERDGIERLLRELENDTSIGIIAPKLVHDDGTVRSSARAFPRPLDVIAKRTALGKLLPDHVERYLQSGQPLTGMRDVDWVVGGCLLARTQLLRDELRGFDRRFFLFFEDIDLCRRCWNAGKRVVFHADVTASDRKRRLSEMNLFRMPFNRVGRAHIVSALKYFWKWRGKPMPR